MRFEILEIDRSVLVNLESLLSASAGYSTSMSDELKFFGSESQSHWFYALDATGTPIGFVRSFNQGEWSHGELFVTSNENRSDIAIQLLKKFLEENSFGKGHRLRFDLASTDVQIISAIEERGLNEKSQTFLYYELDLSKKPLAISQGLAEPRASASEVAETLSHLHPVKIDEVQKWIEEKSIRSVSHEGKVVAAAQFFKYGESAEIIRVATHSNYLRRGFSKALIHNICDELQGQDVRKLFVKVEDTRTPAVEFYEKFGFVRNFGKTQTWFSKYF